MWPITKEPDCLDCADGWLLLPPGSHICLSSILLFRYHYLRGHLYIYVKCNTDLIVSLLLSWRVVARFWLQPAPVNGVLDHEIQKVHADTSTIYSHEPSKEHNEAWEDLLAREYYRRTFLGCILILKAMHMSATKHELEESHDDPDDRLILVKTVPGGVGQGRWTNGDYLATLGVYHELHCLVSFLSIDVVIMKNKLTKFFSVASTGISTPIFTSSTWLVSSWSRRGDTQVSSIQCIFYCILFFAVDSVLTSLYRALHRHYPSIFNVHPQPRPLHF